MSVSDRPPLRNRRRRTHDRRQAGDRRVTSDPGTWRGESDGAPPARADGPTPVKGTIGVRSTAHRVAITEDGAFAYVKHADDGTVSLIRTADNTVVVRIGPDGTPFDMSPSPPPEPVRVTVEPSAETPIREIGLRLHGLMTTGVLKPGWVDAFLATLGVATVQLRQGNPVPISHILRAFIDQVAHFERVGILHAAPAAALRCAAEDALQRVGA